MWCRLLDTKGQYRHNTYGYSFDLKCVDNLTDIDDDNPHWREFETKEDAMKLYNLTKIENYAS